MPNDYKMINSERIQLTDEEQAVVNAERQQFKDVDRPATYFKILRNDRNQRLSETDYMFGSDSPSMSDEKRNEWRAYRQALRDLPENTPNPLVVSWPTQPS